jgi:hypothetical protein
VALATLSSFQGRWLSLTAATRGGAREIPLPLVRIFAKNNPRISTFEIKIYIFNTD